MTSLRLCLFPVLVLALVSCDASAPTAPDEARLLPEEAAFRYGHSGDAVSLPFHLKGSGGPAVPDPLPACPDGFVPTGNEASGTATHLGRFRSVHQQCVNFTTLQFVNGYVVYHAANGDELYASFDQGQLTWRGGGILGYDDSPVVVVGGTGRFEDASGLLNGGGRIDTSDGSFTFWAEGHVDLVRP